MLLTRLTPLTRARGRGPWTGAGTPARHGHGSNATQSRASVELLIII